MNVWYSSHDLENGHFSFEYWTHGLVYDLVVFFVPVSKQWLKNQTADGPEIKWHLNTGLEFWRSDKSYDKSGIQNMDTKFGCLLYIQFGCSINQYLSWLKVKKMPVLLNGTKQLVDQLQNILPLTKTRSYGWSNPILHVQKGSEYHTCLVFRSWYHRRYPKSQYLWYKLATSKTIPKQTITLRLYLNVNKPGLSTNMPLPTLNL